MKNIRLIFTTLWALFALDAIAATHSDQQEHKAPPVESAKSAEECQAPKWAIAIGHEQMWKLHNGCPTDEDKAKSDN